MAQRSSCPFPVCCLWFLSHPGTTKTVSMTKSADVTLSEIRLAAAAFCLQWLNWEHWLPAPVAGAASSALSLDFRRNDFFSLHQKLRQEWRSAQLHLLSFLFLLSTSFHLASARDLSDLGHRAPLKCERAGLSGAPGAVGGARLLSCLLSDGDAAARPGPPVTHRMDGWMLMGGSWFQSGAFLASDSEDGSGDRQGLQSLSCV